MTWIASPRRASVRANRRTRYERGTVVGMIPRRREFIQVSTEIVDIITKFIVIYMLGVVMIYITEKSKVELEVQK